MDDSAKKTHELKDELRETLKRLLEDDATETKDQTLKKETQKKDEIMQVKEQKDEQIMKDQTSETKREMTNADLKNALEELVKSRLGLAKKNTIAGEDNNALSDKEKINDVNTDKRDEGLVKEKENTAKDDETVHIREITAPKPVVEQAKMEKRQDKETVESKLTKLQEDVKQIREMLSEKKEVNVAEPVQVENQQKEERKLEETDNKVSQDENKQKVRTVEKKEETVVSKDVKNTENTNEVRELSDLKDKIHAMTLDKKIQLRDLLKEYLGENSRDNDVKVNEKETRNKDDTALAELQALKSDTKAEDKRTAEESKLNEKDDKVENMKRKLEENQKEKRVLEDKKKENDAYARIQALINSFTE